MQSKYDIREENEQEGEHVLQELAQLLEGFLSPLLLVLDSLLDIWNDFHPALGRFFPPNVQTIQVLASRRC